MLNNTQMTFADVNDEYAAFIEKFKPKKTTDDCYTPENIYQAVKDWACNEYGINPDNIVRPFWPGGDYERHEYPEGCAVIDNPPFSIITSICRHYIDNGIRFFLFAPYLTNFSSGRRLRICHIITASDVTYENGAVVKTCFLTNMDRYAIRTACDLAEAIAQAEKENRSIVKKELPKYDYPDEVLTSTAVGYMVTHGVDYNVFPKDCKFISALEAQKATGKAIFGGGFLLSQRAAAERAAAERAAAERTAATKWQLSEAEKAIIQALG